MKPLSDKCEEIYSHFIGEIWRHARVALGVWLALVQADFRPSPTPPVASNWRRIIYPDVSLTDLPTLLTVKMDAEADCGRRHRQLNTRYPI